MDFTAFNAILELALQEDLAERGDITSRAIFKDQTTKAVLYSKDTGIIAGIPYFDKVFARVDSSLEPKWLVEEGSYIEPGMKLAEVEGLTAPILEAERTAINFLSFLSGIATQTNLFHLRAKETGNAVILDTRKTLPGYRVLSKYAVHIGGGKNHRMGLYDLVMIKDNHIDACGSITSAVDEVKKSWGDEFRIEVECRNLDEVKEAISAGADIIMLDNMIPQEVVDAVKIKPENVEYEASGNMNLERIAEYSPLGIDFISVGKLTHSVKAFDFSLKIGQ